MGLRVIEYRQLTFILTMFLIVQFSGILLASIDLRGVTTQQIASAQIATTPISALFLIAYIVILSAVMIFLFRVYKGNAIFKIIEGAVIFIASFFVFFTLLGNLNLNFGLVAAVILAIALVIAKNRYQKLKNLTAMIASVGVGLVLGLSFSFLDALIFMAILAAYDFIAVFVTKHMLTLANVAIENNLALLIDVKEVEAVPESYLSKGERTAFEKEKASIEKNARPLRGVIEKGMVPMAANVSLGTGDLAMPLMVAISAFGVSMNFTLSIFVTLGAALGLILTMFILRRFKRALPAIPPLLFGVLIGVGVYYLLAL
ncbi:MAG: hypothetical protein LVQ97_01250 [Candidatus Micrarchaeales archaeon]|nr:hypothetical protein [Candidatus Micrarchaeales archaeon]